METERRVWTLLPLLETTARFFREKGLESPRIDAELLLASLLGARRIDLYLQHDRPLSTDEVGRFREMVRSRSRGVPVQRIVGETEFYSIPLGVAEGVFIPRPETELLVDKAAKHIRARGGGEGRLAFDGGTGTGAIAIALARNAPGLRVVAVDRSPLAVSCASANAERSAVADRVEVREADFEEALLAAPGSFEVVLSNPPYVTTAEMAALPAEVGSHDPAEALHAGADGLDAYRRLIPAAARALAPGGLLVLEVSEATAEGAANLVREAGRLGPPAVEPDLAGRKRVLSAAAD